MEMEKEKAASWWNKLPSDFKTEICARLPVEFVYSYQMISKKWNDLLSSNYFLTKWAEAPLNSNQPRLALCDFNMETPCMAFCFYTRTWINSSFDFSFLKDGDWQQISSFKQSVGGLILVANMVEVGSRRKLCNPYTRTFIEIPAPHARHYSDCIVVDECDTSYKVAAVQIFHRWDEGRWWENQENQQLVEIYEPSQKEWKIAGYFPPNLMPQKSTDLIYYNGTFYTYCYCWVYDMLALLGGIASFTIPLEEGITTIPMRFVQFPQKLRNGRQHLRMITCGSRLLFISANVVFVENRKQVDVISVWELKFKSEEGHPVPLSNSPAWEFVELAEMPSSLWEEWMGKIKSESHLYWDCTGVGDHVCFTNSHFGKIQSPDVIAYNLIDNSWSWLPSCPISHGANYESVDYGAIAIEPNPRIKVE